VRSNQAAVPIAGLTIIGSILVFLGVIAGGAEMIIALGLGAVAVAAVLGTILANTASRLS
jgi:hypothetical protein